MRSLRTSSVLPVILLASFVLLTGGCSGSEAEASAEETEASHDCGAGCKHDHDKTAEAHADCGCGDTCAHDHDAAKAEVELPEGSEWTQLSVSGMTCGGCEKRVREALGELEAILAIDADAQRGEVRIALAEGHTLDELLEAIGSEVEKLGFELD